MKNSNKPSHSRKPDIVENKLATPESQLRESEDRFRETFEQAAVGIAHVSLDGRFLRINQVFCDIVGFTREEMQARTFQDITHSDDLAPDLEYVQQLLDRQIETYSMDKRYLRKDGTVVWVSLTVSLTRQDSGEPGYFFAVVQDITDRKEAVDRFRLLAEQAGDAFFIFDYEGEISDANRQACRSLGYSLEELVGMKISEVDVEVEEKQHVYRFWNSLEPGHYITFEGLHRRKDGSTFHVEVRLGRLDLKEKKFLLALARDITDRKQKETKLKKHGEFQELISRISCKFLGLSGVALEQATNDSLAEIGSFFDSDTVRLYRLSLKGDVVKIRNFWRAAHLAPPEEMAEIHKLKFPNLADHYSRGDSVVFSTFDDSPDWPEMRKILKIFGTKAGVGVPLESDSMGVDVFAMDKVLSEHTWPENIVEHSKAVGQVLLSAMRRREAEVELLESFDEIKQLKNRLEQENIYLQEEIRSEHRFEEIIGNSNELKYTLHRVEEIAPTDTTVLILGETGTGKDLIARAIHVASKRKERPLVTVNCAALPSNLIESELFGHEKGAYSGAHSKRIGRFEFANGATLFLDEIGELPLDLQAKLLRVLQDGQFERLGSSMSRTVDVRVIASTNRNLDEAVTKGHFRKDLYYRLNVIPITLMPLRQRKEDIPPLVKHFTKKHCRKHGKKVKQVSQKTIDLLLNYQWPGNIRELESTIERAVITSPGIKLKVELPAIANDAAAASKTLEEIERDYILKILKKTSWQIAGTDGAAEILGMHSNTLRSRMAKLGIRKT